jgi:hypothetical protein
MQPWSAQRTLAWQASIEIVMFVPLEPEAIWPFVLKWGSHDDEDVRMAIATCLLEVFPRGETAAKSNIWFAKTIAMCWKFGEAKEPTPSVRFDHLCSEIRKKSVYFSGTTPMAR